MTILTGQDPPLVEPQIGPRAYPPRAERRSYLFSLRLSTTTTLYDDMTYLATPLSISPRPLE